MGNVRIYDKTNQANGVHTSSSGEFTLLYPTAGAKPGMKIQLELDTLADNGKGLEVVNQTDLYNIIPLDPSVVKEIVVCRKGERDLVARSLFKILQSTSERERVEMSKKFKDLIKQTHKDYAQIAEMGVKLGKLSKQCDSLTLYNEALSIVSINTDKASAQVKKYIQLIEQGVSVQEARKELNKADASRQLMQSADLLNKGINALEVRTDASFSIFDFRDAADCLDTLIHYGQKITIDPAKLARWYFKKSDALFQEGNLKAAFTACRQSFQIDSMNVGDQKSTAGDLVFLSVIAKELDDFKAALNYGQRGLEIYQKINDPDGIAEADEVIGLAYQLNLDLRQALKYQLVANDVTRTLHGKNDWKLSKRYTNIAATYEKDSQFAFALDYQQAAIEIDSVNLGPLSPRLALMYNNLALIYMGDNKPDTARLYQESALYIIKKGNREDFPIVTQIYKNYARILNQLKDYSKALTYINKALAIDTLILPRFSSRISENFSIMAQIKSNLNDCQRRNKGSKKGDGDQPPF